MNLKSARVVDLRVPALRHHQRQGMNIYSLQRIILKNKCLKEYKQGNNICKFFSRGHGCLSQTFSRGRGCRSIFP